jgi:hypothetical protein
MRIRQPEKEKSKKFKISFPKGAPQKIPKWPIYTQRFSTSLTIRKIKNKISLTN